MAVLNLLLAGNTQARSIPELADVVARHSWTQGRKFLLVPYHMIGARDMESAILGQYAEYVRKKHPEAPVPGFYLAEGLFKDARELRERMGDEPFFAQLNKGVGGGGGGGGWGEFDSGWDAASFEAAMLEPPNGEERSRLVGDLITQYLLGLSQPGGQRRVLRLARRWSQHHEPPRPGAGLRRGHPVPGRAGALAGQPRRRRQLRQPRGHQAGEAGGGHQRRPARSAGQLRRAPARPARPGGREPGRRRCSCSSAMC